MIFADLILKRGRLALKRAYPKAWPVYSKTNPVFRWRG